MVLDDGSYNRLIQKLSAAAIQNDATQVGSLLGCRRKTHSPSIDEPLLSGSELAKEVQRRLLFSDTPLSPHHDVSLQHGVKALLVCPSIYETPWKTACLFIQHVHRNEVGSRGAGGRSVVRSTVADIQSFLQQTVASWWEEERKRTAASHTSRKAARAVKAGEGESLSQRNPRHWILELVQVVLEPLFQQGTEEPNCATEKNPNQNEHWTLPLDLLSTIVSLSNDLEVTLLHNILDIIFQNQKRVRPDCILSWINAALDFRLFLRDEDWASIGSALRETLTKQPPALHRQDLPGLAQSILSLCTVRTANGSAGSRGCTGENCASHWHDLILMLLSAAASTDLATFSTIETILESSLASLPSRALMQWTFAVTASSPGAKGCFKAKWILANMLLLILRASRRSGSQLVSRLVAQAFAPKHHSGKRNTNTQSDYDLNIFCWNELVWLCLPNSVSVAERQALNAKKQHHKSTDGGDSNQQQDLLKARRELRRIFCGVAYSGKGCFVSSTTGQEQTAAHLTSVGGTVFRSLFLENDSSLTSSHLLQVMERAQAWAHCASEVFELRRENSDVKDLAVAIVIFVTIYCEVPMSRSSLSRTMRQALQSDTYCGANLCGVAAVYALVVSVVLRSLPDSGVDSPEFSSELDQIADTFAQPLPLAAFSDLAWALSPLASVRQALLLAAQKRLSNTSRVYHWHATENSRRDTDCFDSIRCGLLSLVVLVVSAEWNDTEVEAWYLLSELIVSSRPSLPVQARSWLFEQLEDSVRNNRFSWAASGHLLRACLVRMLSFITSDKNGRNSFLFGNAFVTWGDGCTTQTEDVVGLFHLTFGLLRYGDSGNAMIEEERHAAFDECRRTLPGLLKVKHSASNDQTRSVEDHVNLDTSLSLIDADGGFVVYVAFYCLVLSQVDLVGRVVFGERLLPSCERLRALLVEEERKAVEGFSHGSSLPSWLNPIRCGGTIQSRPVAFDKELSRSIHVSLYDLVGNLLLDPESLLTLSDTSIASYVPNGARRMLALQLGEVFARKRHLANQQHQENGQATGRRLPFNADGRPVDFEGFLSVVLPIIAQSTAEQSKNQLGLPDIVKLILTIVDVCDVNCSASQLFSDSALMERRMPSLWCLYTSLCEEGAADRLYRYMLRHVGEGGSKQVSQTSIRCSDDVDRIVCRVRISVIRTISNTCTEYLRLLRNQSHSFDAGTIDRARSSHSLRYCLRFIGKLTDDLDVGLRGSRGLNYDEHLSFVDCIHQCTAFLVEAVPSIAISNESQSIVSACQKSSKTLESIMCSFVLKDATTFKKTLTLCAVTLPALARCASRSLLLAGVTSSSNPIDGVPELFNQLACILKRKTELDLIPGCRWGEIVGTDQIAGMAEYIDEGDNLVGSDGDDGPLNLTSRNADALSISGNRLLLWSERSWTWSFVCVLRAFENNWDETNLLMLHAREVFRQKTALRAYYTARKSELTEILQSLCALFESHTKPKHSAPTQLPDISLYALALPPVVKSKLVSAIDRILVVLQKSIKEVLTRFRFLKREDKSETSGLSFLEAVCCAFSWISMTTDKIDLSSGIQRWYLAEKKAASRINNVAYSAEESSLRRLPKIIFRLEELELNLCKLLRTLQPTDNSGKNSKGVSELLGFVENLVSGHSAESGSTLSTLVSDKLDFLEREQRLVEADFGLNSAAKKRKRTADLESRLRKERRRRIVRSRNEVVDKWLRMDTKIGADEAQNQDAYADLEDFLVDG